MKKLIPALCIVMVSVTACTDNSTKETTDSNKTTETKKVDSREQEIRDSTKMLDKKLAYPNSNYPPDSLK
jgi:hypothetical protein